MKFFSTPRSGYIPLALYNRLEPRPRKVDFEETLQARLHDPLWMLSRQWQFGEYNFDDNGSPVLAKVHLESTRLTKYKPLNGDAEVYSDEIPLETKVEREVISFGVGERAKIGQQWIKMMNAHLPGAAYSTYDGLYYNSKYGLSMPTPPLATDDEDTILEKAHFFSDRRSVRFINSLSGRVIDGVMLYKDLVEAASLVSIYSNINSAHITLLHQAETEFREWFESIYSQPQIDRKNYDSWPMKINNLYNRIDGNTPDDSCWNNRQLEYQFAFSSPDDESSNNHTVIEADQYYHGHLDWYAFNVNKRLAPNSSDTFNSDKSPHPDLLVTGPEDESAITEKTISLIPSQTKFGGMPAVRWWEFEDGRINFGKLDANVTDIPKILLAQFALVYQDDWCVIPYKIRTGSIAQVKGIVVTDVFGIKTFVLPAGAYSYSSAGFTQALGDEDWRRWNMYNLSVSVNDNLVGTEKADARLFIPPTTVRVQEGEPLEKVIFAKDEMSNQVWGIENIVTDVTGTGRNGRDSSKEYLDFLTNLRPEAVSTTPSLSEVSFSLANNIPENWIPFIPVQAGQDNRQIHLQRASLLRSLSTYQMKQVRPRTNLLRKGIDNDNTQGTPYFINEEEIPKDGIIVESSYQRTRWYNGSTFVWKGHKKTTGKGEGSSALTFDSIVDNPLFDSTLGV